MTSVRMIHIRSEEGRHCRDRQHAACPPRTMIDPRMVEPSIEYGPSSLIGPPQHGWQRHHRGHEVGANLAGMMQNYL
jgi:hypothetical protein